MKVRNTTSKYRAVLVAGAALVLAGAAGARDNERRFTYACEVHTQSGIAGLVMVQANTIEDARTSAARASARTLSGEHSPAMSVVECIETPEGRFRDSQFQRFYDEMPK